MIVIDSTDTTADLRLTRDELIMLTNALNEVCNGVHIDEAEFQTRLAFNRAELQSLLKQVGGLLRRGHQ